MKTATAPTSEWQPMATAPASAKCLLLTPGYIAVIGVPSTRYLAWAPLPKRPAWLKTRRSSAG